MQPKILLGWFFFIISIFGVIYSSLVIIFLFLDLPLRVVYTKPAPSDSDQIAQKLIAGDSIETVQSSTIPGQEISGLPVRLKIPKINVDAAIENVGLTSDDAVGTPGNFMHVAWFNLGPRPGESGNAIFTGHYGWKDKQPSVFNRLYKLRQGDKLYVLDDKGVVVPFVVRESRRYDSTVDASSVFSSSDGKAHLNLITCEGDWNDAAKSYPVRLVVFTDRGQ